MLCNPTATRYWVEPMRKKEKKQRKRLKVKKTSREIIFGWNARMLTKPLHVYAG